MAFKKRRVWTSQPQEAVELADWLPAGTIAYIGGQKRLIGAQYAQSGTITPAITSGGRAESGGTTSSYINAGKVPYAFAAQTWVVQFVARDTSVRFIAGTTNTGTSYNEQIAVNRDEVGGTLAGAFHITLRKVSSISAIQRSTAGGLITVGKVHTAIIRLLDTTTLEIWLDGENRTLTSFGSGPVGDVAGTSEFAYDILNTNTRGSHTAGTNVDLLLFVRTPTLLANPAELSVSPEAPWQLFAPRSKLIGGAAGGGAPTLTVPDSLHTHTLDNVVLTSSTALVVQDMAHGHALDAPTLSTDATLTVADSLHSHALDNVTLSTTGSVSLTVADLMHAHALDNVGLTSEAYLAVADMLHAHALGGVTVTLGGTTLTIADLLHSHALDNTALTLDTYLVVADALHSHALDNVTLSIPGGTIDLILKILANRQELNATTGTFTLYDDDSTTILYQVNAWADAAGTVPYSGGTLARIDRLQ